MKQGIHPKWQDCTVTCSCGNSFTTGSSNKTMQVDICSACHPFFTGEMKFVDQQGRVDKFMQKMKKAKANKQALTKRKQGKKSTENQSYQQILKEGQKNLKQAEATAKTDEQ
jgi:large subunit ribosomal protein L31